MGGLQVAALQEAWDYMAARNTLPKSEQKMPREVRARLLDSAVPS